MHRRLLTLIVVVLVSGTAGAQKPDFAAAKKHYLAGKEAMGKKAYDDAVKEYLAAYDITKDASLFKQVAGAYEAAGKNPEAIVYYKRYVDGSPKAKDLDAIKAKIASLEPPPVPTPETQPKPPETQPAATQPIEPVNVPPPFGPERSRWQRTAAWVSVGLAAVLLSTASVLGTSAMSRQDDVNHLIDFRDPTTGLPRAFTGTVASDYKSKIDEGGNLNTFATVAFIGAGVAVSAATVFFILDYLQGSKAPRESSPATGRITPYFGPNSAGVVAGWEF